MIEIVYRWEKGSPLSAVDLDTNMANLVAAIEGISLVADSMVYKGAIDCSEFPYYPAADCGDVYKISVGGNIGGILGPEVNAGDMIICSVDDSPSGNHEVVGANWVIIQSNLVVSTDGTMGANSDGLISSQKAIKTYVDSRPAVAHALLGDKHTVYDLTPGYVLTALTDTTFGFSAPSAGFVISDVEPEDPDLNMVWIDISS